VGVQSNLPGFRIRSIYVGGGDYLVVAGSTSAIAQQGRRLALDVALIGFIVALVMLVLARLVMRKDLRTMENLIGFASEVARGDERGEIPPARAVATCANSRRRSPPWWWRYTNASRSSEVRRSDAAVRGRRVARTAHALTVIKGYNELLTNPSINDEQRARAVERVRREIDRMDLLVADLLLSAEVREAPNT